MTDQKQGLPGFYAVLPAPVRYDKELRANAKLLYAEISALTNKDGYCWMHNGSFAEQFGMSARSVRDLIGELCDHGYIRMELDPQGENKERRKLYLCPLDMGGLAKICHTPSGKNLPHRMAEICQTNRIDIINNNPPKAPQGGSAADWKPERFEAFWKFYPRGENKKAARRAWNKLKPSDELIAEMGRALKRQMQSRDWLAGVGVPYASTWINGRRWEDEQRGSIQPAQDAVPEGAIW